MTVEILNPEVLKYLYHNHGEFACVCYDTDPKYADRVGDACQRSGHMSGSRCEYIKFKISGIDRGTAEQILRHEIGVDTDISCIDSYADLSMKNTDVSPDQIVKNMASFRYIDKTGFDYAVPKSIETTPDANKLYFEIMSMIDKYRSLIKEALMDSGISDARASQDANMVLPRATTTSLVIGFTPEALIHFCHKRLCSRAQEFIHEVAHQIKFEVMKYNQRFSDELVPHCEYLLWCPEGEKGCGRKPTRKEFLEQISK